VKGIPDSIADFEGDKLGVGIAGMRQRVQELGGELRLRKGNPGTLLEALIPVKSAAPSSTEHLSASRGFSR
jgi:signal transduction histidine kinase